MAIIFIMVFSFAPSVPPLLIVSVALLQFRFDLDEIFKINWNPVDSLNFCIDRCNWLRNEGKVQDAKLTVTRPLLSDDRTMT